MSDWGNGLLSEIENFNVKKGKVAVWFVGGAGFILKKADEVIYIDPFFGGPPAPKLFRIVPIPIDPLAIKKANYVLITHEHYDHCHERTLIPIYSNTEAVFIGSDPVVKTICSWGINKERTRNVKQGDELSINDLKIHVLQSNDPPVKGALIYVIQWEDITFLHSGDSLYFDIFVKAGEKWDIDIAFLSTARNPPGEQMYMTPYDILRATKELKAKMLIPMHWDMWRHTCMDPMLIEFLARTLFPQLKVKILHLGDSIIFPDALQIN